VKFEVWIDHLTNKPKEAAHFASLQLDSNPAIDDIDQLTRKSRDVSGSPTMGQSQEPDGYY
jgi:hypothetical protein